MRRLMLVLGSCLVVAAPLWTTSPAQGAATLAAPLHTSGNQILDATGAPVRMRGLNRDGLEMNSDGGGNLDDNEFAHAREWGANVVRVPLNEDFWTQLCPTTSYDRAYQGRVDALVNSVTSRGMIAVLALARNPRFVCDPNSNAAQKMASSPGSLIFWRSVATRYKNNPLVAFEPYNEPHNISDDVWLNGGPVSDFPLNWQAAGMQQMYATIRGTGAQNLVFVSGISWSAAPPKKVVAGNDIVYGMHVYTCPVAAPPKCVQPTQVGPFGLLWVNVAPVDPYDPTAILDRWTTFAATHPVAITEFGWPSPDDGTYNANVVAAAENRGWGWMAFAWNGSTTGTFNLLADVGPTANYDPSPAGVPIKQALTTAP
ncbi:MAG: cellulose-binding family [Acidimicrobiales bacterium]|nr:cellulose-binding family [Acidimicrobiales bacterium]